MAPISKAKKARKANIKKAAAVNPFHSRQLRHQKSNRHHSKSGTSGPTAEPSTSNSCLRNPTSAANAFDRQAHMKKCTKISVEKAAKKKVKKMRRMLGIKAAAWNRNKSRSLSVDVSVFHTLSNHGFSLLNHRLLG